MKTDTRLKLENKNLGDIVNIWRECLLLIIYGISLEDW